MAKISYNVVTEYLMGVFTSWFVDHQDPPTRPEDLARSVSQFKLKAAKFGDLEYLRVALEHILANSDLDPKILVDLSFNDDYAFDREEVSEIIAYIYKSTWPDRPEPRRGEYPEVEWITGMDWDEWQKRRVQLNPGLE